MSEKAAPRQQPGYGLFTRMAGLRQRLSQLNTVHRRSGKTTASQIVVAGTLGGPACEQILLHPLLASQTVASVSTRRADEIYGRTLSELDRNTLQPLQGSHARLPMATLDDAPLIEVVGMNIVKVTLPPVRAAIEAKEQAEQDALRYRFVPERKRRESERKAVEAEGIRRIQGTVSPTISDSYLRWQGIDATLASVQLPNAKVVVVGSDASGGLLLILGGLGDAPPAAPSPPGFVPPAYPSSPVASAWPTAAGPESGTSTS